MKAKHKYVAAFLHRGMLFGGFGPIVLGIVYLILGLSIDGFAVTGREACLGIVSTYLIAFVHAGTSVFHEVEHWSIPRWMLYQLGALYLVYTLVYLINDWIPFDPLVLLLYTLGFVLLYLLICLTVILSVKRDERRLNESLKQ